MAAVPHPKAHPLCTLPTALPRFFAWITSPIRTAPAAHSPPNPRPMSARAMNICP
jgi:hypothetical protein